MPELPEVETVVKQLQEKIIGKTIFTIKVFDTMVVDKRIKNIASCTVQNVERRGKSIFVELSNRTYLHIHLRMTGHFYHVLPQEKNIFSQKYCVAKFHLSDNSILTYNAIRRFERIQLLTKEEYLEKVKKLGVEPLSKDCTSQSFLSLLSKSPNANIKNKLMDQSCIAGIGNIYAQEALYHAGINPLTKIRFVSKHKLTRLHAEMQRLLKLAIRHNGTTVDNYSHLDGKGNFQDFLAVYQKEACPQHHPIVRTTVAGRGTYYCPRCQR